MKREDLLAATHELRNFLSRSLGGRRLESLSNEEQARIHDEADEHILKRFGVRGWDVAALAAQEFTPKSTSGSDFKVWKALYSALEDLGERENFGDWHVHGDYVEDCVAVVFCNSKDERRAASSVLALLEGERAFQPFSVEIVLTDATGSGVGGEPSRVRSRSRA